MLYGELASNIKEVITERGIKQNYVAQKSGYTPQQFSNMLSGRKIIGGLDVLRIATALEVTPNVLFGIETKAQ